MSGSKSRRKGHDYERKIAAELRQRLFPDCLTARAGNPEKDSEGVDLINTGHFNFQCKAVEAGVNYLDVLQSMPKGEWNVILHKRRRKELAIMPKELFLEIIARAAIYRGKDIK